LPGSTRIISIFLKLDTSRCLSRIAACYSLMGMITARKLSDWLGTMIEGESSSLNFISTFSVSATASTSRR